MPEVEFQIRFVNKKVEVMKGMKILIPFLVALPSLFFATFAFADECEKSSCRTACDEDGGCIYLHVKSINYPYVVFTSTYEEHKSEVDCSQFRLRYISNDGSRSSWDLSQPDFIKQAKMSTACHIMFHQRN